MEYPPRRARASSTGCHRSATLAAWERFAAGDDDVRGVPTAILLSWHRCRDVHKLDPHTPAPPPLLGEARHRVPYCGVFARLGGIASEIVDRNADCLATVTDGEGRILASWGSGAIRHHGAQASLEPYFGWSESSTGTNGMGTALVERRAVSVRGPEHWCESMHGWSCTGVALQDEVSHDPVAALNVSTLGDEAPVLGGGVAAQLSGIRDGLRRQAERDGTLIAAAFAERDRTAVGPLIAVDVAGNVVAANDRARQSLPDVPEGVALEPSCRGRAESAQLREVVERSVEAALGEPQWTGVADLGAVLTGESEEFAITPVWSGALPIGLLLAGGAAGRPGASVGVAGTAPPQRPDHLSRVAAVLDGRVLLLSPTEIRYAEADRHTVWLTTDIGRLRALTHGIDQLERELGSFGFARLHRSYLVNVARIREVSHHGRGVLTVSTHLTRNELIPVSRRSTPMLREYLGL